MQQPNTADAPDTATMTSTILCVDDESNILSALRRLLRPHKYRVLLAESGRQGLEILEQEQVDLVISDMRMPEMDGAAFLTEVSSRWPDTMRILLTGYSDMSATINAINNAQIFKYVSKPWEDNDLVMTIQKALEFKHLKSEKQRLDELTKKQNEELKDLNNNLELKVKQRTSEIEQTLDMYEMANEELKHSYSTIIEVFSRLVAMRNGDSGSELQEMADMARTIAKTLGMSDSQAEDVYHAALLKDIGMVGFPDSLLQQPLESMRSLQANEFKQHPVIAQGLLMSLEPLQNVAAMIRSQHEHYDGSGFPDGIGTDNIPLGSRILCVVGDYFGLQKGKVITDKLSAAQAREFLHKHINKRYDAKVVNALPTADISASPRNSQTQTQAAAINTSQLQADMKLSADLVSSGGLTLLPRGYIITEEVINRIKNLENSIGERFEIHVTRI